MKKTETKKSRDTVPLSYCLTIYSLPCSGIYYCVTVQDSPTERLKTERRMTEHRMTERRKTEHQMTQCRKVLNVERPNTEFECRKTERRKIPRLHIL
jgi:hypothetical protein